MSLDLKRLEKVAELADGLVRARCPACAENGQDKKGEHLRVYPDGRFGCCVFPRDREHRKRIFALAGDRGEQGIKVRVTAAKSPEPIQAGILGRLGQAFRGQPSGGSNQSVARPVARDARDGVGEVQTRSEVKEPPGTPGTGSAKSKRDIAAADRLPLPEKATPGTPGTGFQNSRVYLEKVPSEEGVLVSTLKEFREGVPGVPERTGVEQTPAAAGKVGRMPFFKPDGTLVIPFDSRERFHYWKPGGQSVSATQAEIQARMADTGG